MGLGLYVSSTLATLQGGSLTYSHDGEFSIFTLRLPVAPEVGAVENEAPAMAASQ